VPAAGVAAATSSYLKIYINSRCRPRYGANMTGRHYSRRRDRVQRLMNTSHLDRRIKACSKLLKFKLYDDC